MDIPSRRQLVEALIPVIRRAGAIVCSLQKSKIASYAKPDGSPVTSADLVSHHILCAGCRALRSDIPIISEEDKGLAIEALTSVAFIIDPLDGTKEFIRGRDEFTINIALIEEGRATAGLIYAPARDRLFFSYGDRYVFEEASDGQRRNLIHSVVSRPPIVLVSRSHLDPRTQHLLTRLQSPTVRKLGSSLKFALIAAGEADAYVRLSPTMIWDCAAGLALVEAAGGGVLRTDGLPLLERANTPLKIDGFIAARTPQLAKQLIVAAQELALLKEKREADN